MATSAISAMNAFDVIISIILSVVVGSRFGKTLPLISKPHPLPLNTASVVYCPMLGGLDIVASKFGTVITSSIASTRVPQSRRWL